MTDLTLYERDVEILISVLESCIICCEQDSTDMPAVAEEIDEVIQELNDLRDRMCMRLAQGLHPKKEHG